MTDDDLPGRARRAARRLASTLLDEPSVALVDVAHDPGSRPCVRVHLRCDEDVADLELPSQVDGVPVVLRRGTYELQGDESSRPGGTMPPESGEAMPPQGGER